MATSVAIPTCSFSDLINNASKLQNILYGPLQNMLYGPPPQPLYIKRQDGVTHVAWSDGTHTCVKLSENDTQDSLYSAYCAALAKKLYGNNTRVHRLVDEHTVEYLEEQQRLKREAIEQKRKEEEQRNHAKKVKALAKQLRLIEEARAYNESLGAKAC